MEKLLEFQKKVDAISKDSTNPFFKSKYFDINKLLGTIKPVLNEMKIVILQPLSNVDGRPAVRTILFDVESKIILSDDAITLPDLQDPQKMGSAITYYRRYSLQSLLGLEAEDDDGEGAKPNVQPKSTQSSVSVPKLKDDKQDTIKEIVRLCDNLDTTLLDNKKYSEFIQDKCGCKFTPSNFEHIIKTLKELN